MDDCVSNSQLTDGLSTPKRNRFFYGKLLTALNLEMEQSYFNQKRWLLNQLSLGAGVLCGLRVTAGEGQVCISPGAAIDGFGREIIVPRAVCLDPWQPTDDCGRPGPPLSRDTDHLVTICLAYHECPADYGPALATGCSTEEACEAGTILEDYRLLVRAGKPAPPAAALDPALCAALFGPGRGNQTPAGRLRVLCQGLEEACPAPDEPCIPLAAVQLKADGTLGRLDACTARPVVVSNAVLLELILCLAERVDECCAPQPTATPTPTPSPTPTPTVAPTPAPTPTPPPEKPIRVSGVTFLGANNRVILKLSDPQEVAQIKVSQRLLAIRVAFTGDVDHGSLTTGRVNEDPRKFSFLVQRVDDAGGYVPGLLTPESSAVTRFSIDVEMQAFQIGEHRLTLFGDKDRARQRPAVAGMDGLRLDGEPLAFPSGDGAEGGNFVIRFNIT